MGKGWKKDLNWSAKVFSEMTWPVLNKVIPGKLVHVELVSDHGFAKELDCLAGIDAWHIVENSGVRGIASRVQRTAHYYTPFNTFTIRKSRDSGTKTEYQKRKDQIESSEGFLYPHLTVQTYISTKENTYLRSIGVAKTKDIINKITKWIESGQPTGKDVYVRRTQNASFFVVEWFDDLMVFTHGEV